MEVYKNGVWVGTRNVSSWPFETGDLLERLQTIPKPTRTPLSTSTLTPTPTSPQSGFDPSRAQPASYLAPVSFKLPVPASAPQQQSGPITIDYVYDPLYRLTEANYSNGDYYHYTYDAVGNRLMQTTQLSVISYQYDIANRLISVDGVNYTWDNNGNLLNDGVNTYAYDSANRLTSISGGQTATYAYNGLGDRVSTSSTYQLRTGVGGHYEVANGV